MILGKTFFWWASIMIQILLIWVNRRAPRVYPEHIKNRFTDSITAISIILTGITITVFPVKAPVLAIAIGIFFFAVAPPCIGLAENRWRTNGEQIFERKRFWPHLSSNAVGAAAATLFFVSASTTHGLPAFATSFRDQSAFNVVLPLVTIVVFAFLRSQQVDECPTIDDVVKSNGDWESAIRGNSLTARHQIANTIHLLLTNFIGASSVLYLLGYTILQAKAHHPLSFTWQMGLAMALFVLYLFICGSPPLWQYRAVYLTFLTGMPGVLIVVMIWLALLQPSFSRNLFAVLLITIGYLLYSALAVLGLVFGQRRPASVTPIPEHGVTSSSPPNDRVELFYFAAAMFALALAVLLGALYFSNIGPPP